MRPTRIVPHAQIFVHINSTHDPLWVLQFNPKPLRDIRILAIHYHADLVVAPKQHEDMKDPNRLYLSMHFSGTRWTKDI